jgi:microcompartment protein CcmL/EutN
MTAINGDIKKSRRSMLAGGGASMAGVAIFAGMAAMSTHVVANPDENLRALCAKFEQLVGTVNNLYSYDETQVEDEELRDSAHALLWDQQDEIAHQIYSMKATTLEGARARARAIVTYNGAEYIDANLRKLGFDGALMAALLRDLVS